MVKIIEEITLEEELKDILNRNTSLELKIKQGDAAVDELKKNKKRMREIMQKLMGVKDSTSLREIR